MWLDARTELCASILYTTILELLQLFVSKEGNREGEMKDKYRLVQSWGLE
jgi:hypothetical protein